MRKIVAKVVLAGMVMSVTGCGGKTITHETEATAVSGAEESGAEEKVKVGFIVGTGGLGDQGFNEDRKSTRLNSSHITRSRMPSSA